jgi:hypothetical protein
MIFTPHGLRAAVVVKLLESSLALRAGVLAAWCILATPVIAGGFDAPGTRTLRALGVPRGFWVATALGFVMVVQLPWFALLAVGGGFADAMVAALLAAAIQMSLAASASRPRAAVWGCIAFGLAMMSPPPWATALPALGLAFASTDAAWRGALYRPGAHVRFTRPSHPVLALMMAHALRLLRTARARLSLAATTIFAGGAALAMSLRNDPTPRPGHRALAVLSLPIAAAAATLVAPLLENESRMRPWLRSSRTPSWAVFAAFALALATPSSALAAGAGGVAAFANPVPAWQVVPALASWALVLAVAVGVWARSHQRTARRSATVFVIGVSLLGAIATAVTAC